MAKYGFASPTEVLTGDKLQCDSHPSPEEHLILVIDCNMWRNLESSVNSA